MELTKIKQQIESEAYVDAKKGFQPLTIQAHIQMNNEGAKNRFRPLSINCMLAIEASVDMYVENTLQVSLLEFHFIDRLRRPKIEMTPSPKKRRLALLKSE